MRKITLYFEKEREFYRSFFKIAVPVVLQNLMAASFSLIDNIMVGQLGDAPVASVGLANQYFFILFLLMQGVCGGTSIFVSQFWGKKDLHHIKSILGLGLILATASSFLFFITAFLFPQSIMSFFSNDPAVINLGVKFLRIYSFSYVLTAVNLCFAAALRGMHEVIIPMQANMIGIVINTSLNYLLIFGNFGFPAMGVEGAAVSTVIANCVALLFQIFRIYKKRPELIKGIREIFSISKDLVHRFFVQTGIMIGKDMIWAIGVSVYMAIYARMGTEVAASMNITTTVRNLSTVLFIGIANACQIMIGNSIGGNSRERAYQYASRYLRITVVLSLILGLMIIASRHFVLLPYKVSGSVIHGASNVLFVYGLYFLFYVFNMVAVMGVMRGGGDNLFCGIMDTIAVWFIGMPLALLGGFVWKLPIEWVFALISIQEIFKAILLTTRFISGKWINNLVHDI